jgi:hypothetical protein
MDSRDSKCLPNSSSNSRCETQDIRTKFWSDNPKEWDHLRDEGIDGMLILNKKFWEELIAYFPWYDTGHIENDASNNSSIVACAFVTAATFLPTVT